MLLAGDSKEILFAFCDVGFLGHTCFPGVKRIKDGSMGSVAKEAWTTFCPGPRGASTRSPRLSLRRARHAVAACTRTAE